MMSCLQLCVLQRPVSRKRSRRSGQPVSRWSRLCRWWKKQSCAKQRSDLKKIFRIPPLRCCDFGQFSSYVFVLVLVQMELQCEQMSRELAQRRQQSEQEHQALLKRLNEARDDGRAEALKQKEELAYTVSLIVLGNQMLFVKNVFSSNMLKSYVALRMENINILIFLIVWMYQVAKLSRDVAELEGQLDRAQRDKQSLTKQLEETLSRISSQEQARIKVVFVKCTCKPPSHNIQVCSFLYALNIIGYILYILIALSSLTKHDWGQILRLLKFKICQV